MIERHDHSIKVEGEKGGDVTFYISGRMALDKLNVLMPEIQAHMTESMPAKLTVDLAGVEYLDSAGALVLVQLAGEAQTKSIPFDLANMTDEAKRIMGLLDREALTTAPLDYDKGPANILEEMGHASRELLNDLIRVMTFMGELLRAMAYSFLHPRSIRWGDVLLYMKRAGADGLPIVSLISFLLGLIMAFMSSLQLKQFGANIYVASLVAVAMVCELGPLMTAILVAGRSGSAFAAEIGTMKVNEEVDALVAMGFDPICFLAVPKVLATMLVVPLLTLYADLFAIGGGLLVGVVGLDLTVHTYVQQTFESISTFDIVSSLIKAVVFAALIAGIGCQRGFHVKGEAQAVGTATTSAVVSAMFLIIVTDSAFAIVLHYI